MLRVVDRPQLGEGNRKAAVAASDSTAQRGSCIGIGTTQSLYTARSRSLHEHFTREAVADFETFDRFVAAVGRRCGYCPERQARFHVWKEMHNTSHGRR